MNARLARNAFASKAGDFVEARAVVTTRRRRALVNFRVAIVAAEAGGANARKPVNFVATRRAVLARR